MSSHVKGLNPIRRRKTSLKKESSKDVINSMNHSFSFVVLLRSVRTRESKKNTVIVEEIVERGVIEFHTIITLERFYSFIELGLN
jgi:hypothetical protein